MMMMMMSDDVDGMTREHVFTKGTRIKVYYLVVAVVHDQVESLVNFAKICHLHKCVGIFCVPTHLITKLFIFSECKIRKK